MAAAGEAGARGHFVSTSLDVSRLQSQGAGPEPIPRLDSKRRVWKYSTDLRKESE